MAAARVAGAQDREGLYRIGFLIQRPPGGAETRLVAALGSRGWTEGGNYVLQIGVAGNDPARWDAVAGKLLEARVDLIVALGSHMALVAKRATTTIPVVMMLSGNPVAAGIIVTSLSRPGGNITGLRTYVDGIWGKYVELARELLPRLQTLGLLSDYVPPGFVAAEIDDGLGELQRAAKSLGVALPQWRVNDQAGLERALTEIERTPVDALLVTGGPTHAQPRNTARIREFLLRRKLAMINDIPGSVFRDAGGVIAYAVSFKDVAARTASFIDRIRQGAKPRDLPIEQPTQLELVLNLRTAKALRIQIPQAVLLRADRVVE